MCAVLSSEQRVAAGIGCFRLAEKQVTAGTQREVKGLQEPLLRRPIEVNEDVATGDQVQMRKGRVLDDVMRREQHHLAQLPANPVTDRSREKASQSLIGHVGDFGIGVEPLASDGDGALVEVGRKHLNARRRDARVAASASTIASE